MSGPALPVRRSPDLGAVLGLVATAAACWLLGLLVRPGQGPVLCPWRRLTGLPCPLCGGTTAAALGRLDLRGALLANPVVVASGALLGGARLGLSPWRPRLLYGARGWAPLVALAGSELWQLHRLHLLG